MVEMAHSWDAGCRARGGWDVAAGRGGDRKGEGGGVDRHHLLGCPSGMEVKRLTKKAGKQDSYCTLCNASTE